MATRSPVHRLARQHPRQHKPNCDAPSRSPRQQTARRDLVPALTGIAQSNLSALETGARELDRERALVLAKALKAHPAVLLFADFDVSKVA